MYLLILSINCFLYLFLLSLVFLIFVHFPLCFFSCSFVFISSKTERTIVDCTEYPHIPFTDRMAGKDDKLVLELEKTLQLRLRHFLIENDKNCKGQTFRKRSYKNNKQITTFVHLVLL